MYYLTVVVTIQSPHSICKGLDVRRVNRLLLDMGALTPSSDGKASKPTNLPGYKNKPRVYIVNASALAESGGEVDAEAEIDEGLEAF